ncbi:PHP domain-containing protein [candidate division KSB1 bacterium]|nr:PHP domain-containing protein [candidate division KSB1 bacterium]
MVRSKVILLTSLLLGFQLSTTNSGFSQMEDSTAYKWYKGNTHTHTTNSDGDSSPEVVTKWYRDHGYNFLVISDHDTLTEVDDLNKTFGKAGEFILITGSEVTDYLESEKKAIHVNSLNPTKNVLPQGGENPVEMLQNNIDAIREASAIPQINHPNHRWSLTANDLKQTQNCVLFEVHSGHPIVNNLSGGGFPGVEEMWDDILSSGKLIYGMGADDAHKFIDPWDKSGARPGQAWVVVRALELTPTAIVNALEHGNFYASTGVELIDYQVDDKGITIDINAGKRAKYRTLFIGKYGKVYKEAIANPATYEFQGGEMYIRAKIIDSNGCMAWTQPIMLENK